MKRLILSAVVLIIPSTAYLIGLDNYQIYPGAREYGMGASPSLDLLTSSSMFYNPAVPAGSKRLRVFANAGSFNGDYGAYINSGLSYPFLRGVLSAAAWYYSSSTQPDPIGKTGGGYINFSKLVSPSLAFGFALKSLTGSYAEHSGFSIGIDVGAIFVKKTSSESGFGIKDLRYGVSVLNLGKPIKYSDQSDPFPGLPGLNLSAEVGFLRTSVLDANLLLNAFTSFYPFKPYAGAGIETTLISHLSLRTGAVIGKEFLSYSVGTSLQYALENFWGIEHLELRVHYTFNPVTVGDKSFTTHWLGFDFIFGTLDTTPPDTEIKVQDLYFSPNYDGANDYAMLKLDVDDSSGIKEWKLEIKSADGKVVRTFGNFKGAEEEVKLFSKEFFSKLFAKKEMAKVPEQIKWDGTADNGKKLPDGTYSVVLMAVDSENNTNISKPARLILDTTSPSADIKAQYNLFSPNGDGNKDTVEFQLKLSKGDEWKAEIVSADGKVIRKFDWGTNPPDKIVWDGTDEKGKVVADGTYTLKVFGKDKAGNKTEKSVSVNLTTVMQKVFVNAESKGFSPNGDGKYDTITFTPSVEDNKGIVEWKLTVFDETNGVVRVISGSNTIPEKVEWDGKDDKGDVIPDGNYYVQFEIVYESGNHPVSDRIKVSVDTTPPQFEVTYEPEIFSPDGDGEDDLLTIGISATDKSGIAKWKLEVLTPRTNLFKTFSGYGTPAKEIVWDGKGDKGDLVESATDYPVRVTMEDTLANRVQKFVEPIKVDVLVEKTPYGLRIRVSSIEFEFNKADLKGNAFTILDRVGEILKKYPNYQVEIQGHTDNVGTEEYNLKLSQKRAESVYKYLVEKVGIDPDRLKAVGYGETRPIASNDTEEGRARNRRVEFILIKKK